LSLDERNVRCVFDLVGGEDINTSPTQQGTRFAINFGQRSLSDAEAWPALLSIVRERVKPDRDRANEATADGAHRKRYWWQYAQPRPELLVALAAVTKCLVNSQVSKHLVFAFQETARVFTHTLYVFPFETHSPFAVMQSRVHEPWARLLSSSLEDRLRYSASDCFETFPFPTSDPRAVIAVLEGVGQRLYDFRAKYMVDENVGLTITYNRLKDPACTEPRILELRKLHEEMDRKVLDAYGWSDIEVPPYCPMNDADKTRLESFDGEVIDRLFVLNAKRAEEERVAPEAGAARGKRNGIAKGVVALKKRDATRANAKTEAGPGQLTLEGATGTAESARSSPLAEGPTSPGPGKATPE
jgi:hypothetical protein